MFHFKDRNRWKLNFLEDIAGKNNNFPNVNDSRVSFQDVSDRELPNKLIAMVRDMHHKEADTDCVLLLLCKMKPFVWSMQKAINGKLIGAATSDDVNRKKVDSMKVFFEFAPTIEDFKNNGMECEENYKTCKLF